MVIHYKKNKVERVDGSSIDHANGYKVVNSSILVWNPHGRVGNEELIHHIAGQNEDADMVLEVMEAKVRPIEDDKKLVREKILVRGMA